MSENKHVHHSNPRILVDLGCATMKSSGVESIPRSEKAVFGVLTAGIGSKLAIAGKGAVLIGVIRSARGADKAAEAAKVIDRADDIVSSAKAARPVSIPHGTGQAVQEMTAEALVVRGNVESGGTLYRVGTRGISMSVHGICGFVDQLSCG